MVKPMTAPISVCLPRVTHSGLPADSIIISPPIMKASNAKEPTMPRIKLAIFMATLTISFKVYLPQFVEPAGQVGPLPVSVSGKSPAALTVKTPTEKILIRSISVIEIFINFNIYFFVIARSVRDEAISQMTSLN